MASKAHTEFSVGPTGRMLIGTPDQAVTTAQETGKRIHIYRVEQDRRVFVGYAYPDGRVAVAS